MLRAGGGHAFRKVAPKILPRATQDAKFLPPRLVWTVGGRGFCNLWGERLLQTKESKPKDASLQTSPRRLLNFFGR